MTENNGSHSLAGIVTDDEQLILILA